MGLQIKVSPTFLIPMYFAFVVPAAAPPFLPLLIILLSLLPNPPFSISLSIFLYCPPPFFFPQHLACLLRSNRVYLLQPQSYKQHCFTNKRPAHTQSQRKTKHKITSAAQTESQQESPTEEHTLKAFR